MTFVSYAQNFEDAMLWRALKHIPHGVYVDVGAQDPVIDSVSKAFYEHGWRGVHVEPVQFYADMLRKDRPDETVLQVALSDADGVLEMNVIAGTGLSTAVDAVAQRHLSELGFDSSSVRVPMLTLKTALPFLAGKDVHWLKIDVEGLEEQVLRGWDSTTLRPWIMVVEATVPNSPESEHKAWDHLIVAASYQFVYFDGLNRFYVADEHPELLAAFAVPPNVFDNVRLSGLASSELCRGVIARYQGEAEVLRVRVDEFEATAARTAANEQRLIATEQHLTAALAAARALNAQLEREAVALREFGRLTAHIERMEQQHKEADREAARLHAHIAWMQVQWDGAAQALHHSSHELAAVTDKAQRQMRDIYASTSWRLTGPMRRAVRLLRRLRGQTEHSAASIPAVAAAPVPVAPAPDEPVLRELSPRAAKILSEIQHAIDAKVP